MKTLSQISEDLYQLERRLLAECQLPALMAYATVVQIRADLEAHITPAPHSTPGEGIEQKEGTKP